jgi:hypothetical protein
MKRDITDVWLRAVPPPATGRLELRDTRVVGLVLRLTPSGAATWSIRTRTREAQLHELRQAVPAATDGALSMATLQPNGITLGHLRPPHGAGAAADGGPAARGGTLKHSSGSETNPRRGEVLGNY